MWYKSALLILALVVVGVYSQSDPECDGVCYSSGDPHYQSFDCKRFEFQGQCSYTLMKSCDKSLSNFEVISDNERVPYHPDYTYTKSILIKSKDTSTEVRLTGNMDIFVNGVKQDASSTSTEIGSITIVNGVIVVKTIWQFTLSYGSPFKTVISLDDKQLPGKICGICGNANGDPSDDFKTPDNELVDDADLFGDSWNVEANCQGAVTTARPAKATEGVQACLETQLTGEELIPYMIVGTKVVRGQHWKWGDQDGNPPGEGTISNDADDDNWIEVTWDVGRKNTYRIGNSGNFDLQLADSYYCFL